AARSALGEEHFGCLQRLLESYRELIRVAQERGASIARLQRLFGLRNSEKTSAVVAAGVAANQPLPASEPPTADAAAGNEGASAGG
ncbi:MAG: hypothetical protein JW751_07345, partial [Polyangiaceae bacterium]|nr:hypothetical protein [Polyangiaceae bacterium]